MTKIVRVLITPDSFKGTLTAEEAARAMAAGVRRSNRDMEMILAPMADGGEGTIAVWQNGVGGKRMRMNVIDPLAHSISAVYLLLEPHQAVIELAMASGLELVPETARNNENALSATTYGTGQLIVDALEKGVNEIVLALGGSATTDGGFGLLRALGAVYYDADGGLLDGSDAKQLARLHHIDVNGIHPRFYQVRFTLASDVTHLLCGEGGAAAVFGPQKGLSSAGIALRDKELARFSHLLQETFAVTRPLADIPGVGAAGGAGLPLLILEQTKIISGASLLAKAIDLEAKVAEVDWVITGEGRTDAQTLHGKVVHHVAQLCAKYQKPCAVIAGSLGKGYELMFEHGVTHMLAATPENAKLSEIKERAHEWVQGASYHVGLDFQKTHTVK